MFKQLSIWFFLALFPILLYFQTGKTNNDGVIAEDVQLHGKQHLSAALRLLAELENELRTGEFNPQRKDNTLFDIFIYQRSKPYYWSTNDYEISSKRIFLELKQQFLEENDFGKFMVLKGGALQFTIVIVMPLERTYSVHNRFLTDKLNPLFFGPMEGKVSFTPSEEMEKITITDEIHFYFNAAEKQISGESTTYYLLGLLAWCFVVAWLVRRSKLHWGIMLSILLVFRILLLYFVPPFNEHLLFSPEVFASSILQPNLFQYLLNLILLIYASAQWIKKKRFSNISFSVAFLVLLAMLIMIHDLIHHSALQTTPFRIVNLEESTMFLLISLLVTCVSSCVVFIRFFVAEKPHLHDLLLGIGISIVLGFVQPALMLGFSVGALAICMFQYIRKRSAILLPGFMLFLCAFLITFLTIRKEKAMMFNKKISLSNMLVSGDDPYVEYLIQEVSDRIADDRIITSKLKSPLTSSERFVREKIEKVYLSKYFSGYNWNVDVVSIDRIIRNGDALEIDGKVYDVIKKEGEDLYQFVNLGLAQNDYVKLVCFDNRSLIKNIVITLKGKNNPDYSVMPQLLLEGEAGANDMDYNDFNYAVLKGDEMVLRHGDYYTKLSFGELKNLISADTDHSDGYEHFRITQEDEALIISNQEYGLAHWTNTFSLVAILLTLTFLLYYGLRLMFGQSPIMLTEKLQLTFGIIVIITFITLLAVSVGSLSQSYSTQIEEDHLDKAERVGITVTADLISGQIDKEMLERNLNLLARNNQTDIHLYNNEGRLLSTTLPELFEKELKSTLLQYTILHNNGKKMMRERIGDFEFYSAYYPIHNSEKKLLGYINIPFFDAKEALKDRVNTVSYLTLNISFGVLCLLLLISLLISQRITRPILALSKKLDQLDLEKGEPLRWERNDEIGKLVESYNHMLVNLNKSRDALKKQEKQAAWKEMAKQVAHEVKNPLTPMKLSLQFLMRKLTEGEVDPKEVQRTSESMIEQIDNLSAIVESFSEFASMPEYHIERTDIAPILQDVIRLHRHTAEIEMMQGLDSCYINCDGKAIHAIFSNIIINGVQAVSEGKAKINIGYAFQPDEVTISIQDNGDGIPDDVADKVFIPNFSTKYTGSGIGLALAQKGIQEFGGQIWFDTIPGKGTTFYMSLPLSK